jgi:ubiquitin carboxyl-terminal hydrolase 9/24
MKFFLKEGDLYLSWGRCQEIWETLVANPRAITFDRDLCFEWFENCLSDLESETQKEFFQKMLLQVAPANVTSKGFDCFKVYFESVNHSEGKLRKGTLPLYVSLLNIIKKILYLNYSGSSLM